MQIGTDGIPIAVLDEGVEKTDSATSMDFVGAGVTVSGGTNGIITVTIGGGGGGTGYTDIVEFVADLPAAADHSGELYYVYDTANPWPWSNRPGSYRSDGSVWTRGSNATLGVKDTEIIIYDDADPTKALQFELSPIGAGETRVFTPVNANMNWSEVVANTAHKNTTTGNPHDVDSADVEIGELGTATYDDIQDWINNTQSCGLITGGAVTDSGSAQVDVAAGTGFIKATDSCTGVTSTFDFAADTNMAITTNTIRYVVVDYAGGTPEVQIDTTDPIDSHTRFRLATVVNESDTLHIVNTPQKVCDLASHTEERFYECQPRQRAERIGGLILGETGTRDVTISASEIYDGLNEYPFAAFDTSGASTFDSYSSGGLESAGDGLWDNDNYDNAGTLTSLSANKYAVLWWYAELDGGVVCVYGTAQYTSAASAENESAPATLPLRLQAHGLLIGRYIFQKGGDPPEEVQSSFDTAFTAALAADHGNLAGLGDDDHTQYALKSLYDAHTILQATTDDTPVAITIAEQQIAGRITAGNIKGLSATEVRTLISVEENADVTDSANVISSLSGQTLTGALEAADHGTAATDQVINVCYGTGAAPTANTTTIGSLFVKYTA